MSHYRNNRSFCPSNNGLNTTLINVNYHYAIITIFSSLPFNTIIIGLDIPHFTTICYYDAIRHNGSIYVITSPHYTAISSSLIHRHTILVIPLIAFRHHTLQYCYLIIHIINTDMRHYCYYWFTGLGQCPYHYRQYQRHRHQFSLGATLRLRHRHVTPTRASYGFSSFMLAINTGNVVISYWCHCQLPSLLGHHGYHNHHYAIRHYAIISFIAVRLSSFMPMKYQYYVARHLPPSHRHHITLLTKVFGQLVTTFTINTVVWLLWDISPAISSFSTDIGPAWADSLPTIGWVNCLRHFNIATGSPQYNTIFEFSTPCHHQNTDFPLSPSTMPLFAEPPSPPLSIIFFLPLIRSPPATMGLAFTPHFCRHTD